MSNSSNDVWKFNAIDGDGTLIRFNDYAGPRPRLTPTPNHFYSNEPVIQLTLKHRAERVVPLPSPLKWETTPKPIFDDAFSYAAYIAKLEVVSDTGRGDDSPPQPSFKTEREDELREISSTDAKLLCLFNILVALEWAPNPAYLQQLAWAFRRASDFLYDVTDGYMAFGQVVFGGQEFMEFADIQIFASSRLFPRSWVSGMYEPAKHAPIRIGRGLWKKNNHMIIPWDEPEGYRILVHEFAHYALGLKDRYLDPHPAVRARAFGQQYVRSERLIDSNDLPSSDQQQIKAAVQANNRETVEWCKLAIPSIALPVESIMAVLEGTSELVPHMALDEECQEQGKQVGKKSEWDELRPRFGSLEIPPDKTTVDEGPGRLPLPLPVFGRIQAHVVTGATGGGTPNPKKYTIAQSLRKRSAPTAGTLASQQQALSEHSTAGEAAAVSERNLAIPTYDHTAGDQPCIEPDHCWVFVLKGSLDRPERLIAQGSLDNRARDEGYTLLGTSKDDIDDIVILIGNGYSKRSQQLAGGPAKPIVLWAKLSEVAEATAPRASWNYATPASFPVVDMCPEPDIKTQRPYAVRVHIDPLGGTDQWAAYVFPFEENQARAVAWDRSSQRPGKTSARIENLNALDGHVLLVAPNEDGGKQLTIASYSIGGSPSSAFPPMPNPISAGSSEGNAMLFFYDKDLACERYIIKPNYDNKVVVTTVNHGIAAPSGFDPRSYTFSLATNQSLPEDPDLAPTLIIYYDKTTARDASDLFICRYDQQQEQKWAPIPTYVSAGALFTAAPLGGKAAPDLSSDTAPGLMDGVDSSKLQVERYRLCLVRSSASAQTR